MRKLIAAINMTLDGYCDHTAGIPDEEIHYHYKDLLNNSDVVLYGRTTFQLMEFWPSVLQDPNSKKSMYDFAVAIDNINKVVFSHTLKTVNWRNTRIAKKSLQEEISDLKKQEGKEILVGSPGLIIQTLNLGLVDELQLCIYPVVEGKGMALFKNIAERTLLKLTKTKTFKGGAVILYYEPVKPS